MRSRVSFIILLACALSRLRRDRSGASAIEFALVGPLMLVGVFGILEITFMFFATQFLEAATERATRLIMTGQVKSTTVTKEAFKGMVCDGVKVWFDCSKLYVDAQAYTSYSEPPNFDESMIEDKKFVDKTKFMTGKQGDIVVVRTFYAWPMFLAGFAHLGGVYDLSNMEGGRRLISSTAAVRNEPW